MTDTSLVFNLVTRDRATAALGRVREKFDAAATGIGAGAGALLGAGIAASLNVEAANDKLAAQLGLTEAESERVGKVAGDLYANAYGDSIETVNTAVGSVMSSIKGMSTAASGDLQDATAAALNFASAFDIEVDRAVQTAGTLINSGLAADATEAFDLITAASQKVPAQLREDVLDASDEYGQFFRTLGYSGEEAFALLVDSSKKGAFGIDKAGDAIKEFTLLSTDMSAKSTAAYDAIGLDARDMANAILAGGDDAQGATQKIIDGLLGIQDPADRANQAIALFGTPLEDMNVQDIPAFLTSLKGASGSMDGFSGAAKRSGDALNDNAGAALTEFQRKAMGVVTEVGGSFAQFAMDNQTVFEPLAYTLAGLAAAILLVKGGMMAWAAAQAVWSAATTVATGAQWLWNTALLASPITWIILGIVALVAAIVLIATKTTWFQTAWRATMSAIGTAWDWVWTKLQQGFQLLTQLFLNFTGPGLIIKHWDTIKNATSTAWNAVWGFVKAVPGKIVSLFLNWTLPGLIIKHWDTIKNGTVRVATSVVNWVKGLPGKIVGAVSPLGASLWNTASNAWSRFRNASADRITSAVNLVRGLPGRARNAIGSLGGLLYNSGRALIQGFINGIRNMIGTVRDAASSVVSAARDFFPFSPAKTGPFSGKGWTLYSGQALMEGWADGITQRQNVVTSAMADVTQATSSSAPSSPMTGLAPFAGAAAASGTRPLTATVRLVNSSNDPFMTWLKEQIRIDFGGDVTALNTGR